jgi:hypothetical protein
MTPAASPPAAQDGKKQEGASAIHASNRILRHRDNVLLYRFRPLADANPHIGVIGSVAVVDEVKIECVVLEENLATVVSAVKASHPYEEPAIFLSEIIDY